MEPTTRRIVGLSSTTRMRALIVSFSSVSPTTRAQSRTENGGARTVQGRAKRRAPARKALARVGGCGSALAHRADAQFGELVRSHEPGSVTHQVGALLRLRERDHVPDALGPGQQHGDAI